MNKNKCILKNHSDFLPFLFLSKKKRDRKNKDLKWFSRMHITLYVMPALVTYYCKIQTKIPFNVQIRVMLPGIGFFKLQFNNMIYSKTLSTKKKKFKWNKLIFHHFLYYILVIYLVFILISIHKSIYLSIHLLSYYLSILLSI